MSLYQALQANNNNIRYDVNFDDVNCNTINGNIPPSVGTFNNGDIPIRNPIGGSPFFTDSGTGINSLSFPPVEAKILDLNTSYPLTSTVVSIRDTVLNENQMFIGIPAPLGEDSDLILANESISQKVLGIANTNGDIFISSPDVNINDNSNNTINVSQTNGIDIINGFNNSLTLNNDQITLFNDNGSNSINLNNTFGLFINSNSQNVLQSVTNSLTVDPNTINLNSSNTMFINSQNSLTLQDPVGDSISILPNQVNVVSNTGDININSGLRITLNEFTDGHFLKMDNSEVILAANSAKPMTIATDNELRLKASSSYGLAGQVLTSNGSYCEWQSLSLSNTIMNQTLYRMTNFLAGASGTGVIRLFNESGQAMISSAVQSSINTACYLRVDPSDYPETIGTKVRRLQLVYNVVTGSVLPASNFTVQLYTYTSSGIATGLTITAGSAFGNSVTVVAPAINSTTTASSTPFGFPLTATNYVLGITNTASTASFTHHSVYLKVVYV